MIHDLIMSEDGSLKTGGNLIIAPNGDLMAGENIQSLIYFSLYCGSSPLDAIRGERHSDKFELLMSEQRITIALLTQIERQALAQTQWIVDSGIVQNISVTVTTEQKLDTGTRVKVIFNVSMGDKIKSINLDDISKEYNADPFFPSKFGTFLDERDGKIYQTVKIENQIWMTENLAYLPQIDTVASSTVPKYYVYDYNGSSVEEAKATENYQTYGVLYNHKAAEIVAPPGWHLPTDEEWKTLEINIGMLPATADNLNERSTNGEGAKLRSTNLWNQAPSYIAGTDDYGFSALPAGRKKASNDQLYIGSHGYFWTATKLTSSTAFVRWFQYFRVSINRNGHPIDSGYSVRLIKDI